jgi:SRSO17 transposase
MTQPLATQPTLSFIDRYCQKYQQVFPEVRSYQAFKQMVIGIITPSQRKSLSEIAKIVGLEQSQSLHHFITSSPWTYQDLRTVRIKLIVAWLQGEEIDIIIDETGDPKKGKKTEYVDRQYLGRLGKVDNGIVTVNVYGVKAGIVLPLIFEIYKPRKRLKCEDLYKSKPKIAAELVKELVRHGIKIKRVLADSLYGESASSLIRVLERMSLQYMVAIRSNHGVWLLPEEKVKQSRWQKFERQFSDGSTQIRYVREIIFGRRHTRTYWDLTTDPKTLPDNSTSYVMTNIPDIDYREVGNIYGLRTWVEYGFRQSKSELGWADFHLTKYADIAKWWELIYCTFLLISSHAHSSQSQSQSYVDAHLSICQEELAKYLSVHPDWSQRPGWKSMLNNLRLLLIPMLAFNLVKHWLAVFDIPALSLCFQELISLVSLISNVFAEGGLSHFYSFSSA